jgi:predicted acyl esterase
MAIVGACGLSALAGASGKPASAAEPASPPTYEITLQETWITMPDGVRLAADLYLPAGGAPGERFPVLLNYLPYRSTRSGTAGPSSITSYFVRRGYVVARVDIRGTGNSEGRLIEYEYTDQEQEDAEVVIDWLSKRPFSNGNVGMYGLSWGGFNSIHMAMRNPPALKAIIAGEATDDLYEDDVHYMDGGMHVDAYEIGQDLSNARPGAPSYVIDEDYFRNRFDTTPWLLIYKRQQRDMLENLQAPVKAIVGPWAHSWPHYAYPKPQIEWRHEAVRWYDHWLKGRDTGIMEEPRFAVFVRDWHPPDPNLEEIPGEWRFEEGWPLERTRYRTLHPQPDHSLTASAPGSGTHELRYVPTVGLEAGGTVLWWGEVAPDQRPVDAYSLVYDTAPLEEDLEILGMPKAFLNASATAPLAHWFVRLSDVAPEGTVTQVAGAGFNGAHRESAENPKSLKPGRMYPLEIDMHFTSWVFPKGHRIRLAVNNSMWPMIWPTPHPMTTSLRLGGESPTRVVLPVVPHADRPKPSFLPPPRRRPRPPDEDDPGPGLSSPSGYAEVETVERNPRRGTTKIVMRNGGGSQYSYGSGTYSQRITYEAQDDHPESPSLSSEYETNVQLEDRLLTWQGLLSFRSDRKNFYYTYTRRLLKDGELVREKTWDETIPRDHQ